ncbi:MAG: DUF1398 domain-containing protein [Alphaproteobacteria bacterium]|nr:DUF1398 domain-containing protein [Alphaproteobacteria bacterium]
MDINVINECTELSLAGKITFPEVVMKLAAIGVERYIVDLVGFQKLSYGQKGEFYIKSFSLIDSPMISENFDAEVVKAVIKEIQQQQINYVTFLRKIMEAGCCHYEVYIQGKKVIYFGRDGSHHIENFPSGK